MNLALTPVRTATPPLARYDEACRAVAEARTVDDVQAITAHADAIRAYAKQAKNRQLELDAAEIRIRAERRLGELMAAQREAVGVNKGGGDRKSDHRVEIKPGDLATLAEAGIDKNLAHRARTLAAVPEAKFEELLGEKRHREDRRVVLAADAPRDDRLAPEVLEGVRAENGALSRLVDFLKQRVATLRQDNRALRRQVQMWKGRAHSAGWKERTDG